MRILHVIETLRRGGAEQVLVNLLPELQRLGLHNEVAVLWPNYDHQPTIESYGIKVHRLGTRFEARWNIWNGANRIAALARRGGFDIIHAQLVFADLYVGTSRLWPAKTRRVVTFQNTDFDYFDGRSLNSRLARQVLPPVLRHGFDAYTAVGLPVKQHYHEHVPGLDITYIPNAIPASLQPDPQLDRRALRAEHNLGEDDFVISVPARLAEEKGHRFLFEALENLRERKLHPKVLLFGQGPLQEELEQSVRAKALTAQVQFLGNTPHSRLLPLLQASDLFVLASTQEGLPLSAGEAMALGVAPVTTTAGGLVDLIEPEVSGLLVPPADPPALASAIERVMKDSALKQRLGAAARTRIAHNFSTGILGQRWKEFYQSTLER
jgi:glycosyltransferase involved in cell wall biosynthesis